MKNLQLDMIDGEIAQQSIMNGLLGGTGSQVMDDAIWLALGTADLPLSGISTVADLGLGTIVRKLLLFYYIKKVLLSMHTAY